MIIETKCRKCKTKRNYKELGYMFKQSENPLEKLIEEFKTTKICEDCGKKNCLIIKNIFYEYKN